jgi:hypothetical protein
VIGTSRLECCPTQFLIRRADRLMFGTDYLFPGKCVPQLKLLREIDLPPDVQAKIFCETPRGCSIYDRFCVPSAERC